MKQWADLLNDCKGLIMTRLHEGDHDNAQNLLTLDELDAALHVREAWKDWVGNRPRVNRDLEDHLRRWIHAGAMKQRYVDEQAILQSEIAAAYAEDFDPRWRP